MLTNRHINAMLELQKVMQRYGKDIARALEAYGRIEAKLAKSLKPFYENMELIQKSMSRLAQFTFSPSKEVLKSLKEMQQRIETMHYPNIDLVNINPEVLMPKINEDANLKCLIKEAIEEYEVEKYEERKEKIKELSKKRKIKGFACGKEKE